MESSRERLYSEEEILGPIITMGLALLHYAVPRPWIPEETRCFGWRSSPSYRSPSPRSWLLASFPPAPSPPRSLAPSGVWPGGVVRGLVPWTKVWKSRGQREKANLSSRERDCRWTQLHREDAAMWRQQMLSLLAWILDERIELLSIDYIL